MDTLNKRLVIVWGLYDFANSVYPAVITSTVFSVYFITTIVGNDTGLGDLWWGRMLSVSMLFVAVSSPLFGFVADHAGIRKKMLFLYTCLCAISVFLFTTIEPGMIIWGFSLAVIANIGFEGALVYYNAYLPEISPPGKRGLVSGIGFGMGYAGSAIGLLVALPLVMNERFDLAWISVSVFFMVFSIPAFLMLPKDKRSDIALRHAARESILKFKGIINDVWNQTELRRFLLAYFLYIDGVNTTFYFSAIFAVKTLGFSTHEVIYLFLAIQLSALVGAFMLAKPTDIFGPKKIISFTLMGWTLIVISAYFIYSKEVFFLIAVLAGAGMGSLQSASRALMSILIPKGKEAEMFGFYAFCGKSSSIIGPLIFGWISYSFGGNQRISVLTVAVFFVAGILLLQRVKEPMTIGK